MNALTTTELITLALTQDRDEDLYWDTISTLWCRPDVATFESASHLLKSGEWEHRAVGVDIMAQLGISSVNPLPVFREQAVAMLSPMALDPRNAQPELLNSIICAISHQGDPASLDLLIRFKNDPYWQIRWNIVCSLPKFQDERAVEALIEMTEDEDETVRDWATFGLGTQCDVDTPEVREALARRLQDTDNDTRNEAIRGLAARGDKRVLHALKRELETGNPQCLAIQAVCEVPPPSLLPALLHLKALDLEGGTEDETLDSAIAKCRALVP